ncbi:hypothetical protein L9F63_010568 [Diploptera punctata]|uniref:Ionotropic glutamate receptor C-terminal domain-containing protein n=1 Tax=Diploptera punctata TaxID=6984 RepID=A0AAD8AGX9_DIPPU|nr:hypothetical protein L9F63_010568 [Diploptera punctata]
MITWGLLLGVSVRYVPRNIRQHIVFFAWVIFSIAFSTVFQTFMTSFFTDPGRHHQIDSVEEMDASNLELILDTYQIKHWHLMISNNSHYCFSIYGNQDSLKVAANDTNAAVLFSEDIFMYNYPLIPEGNRRTQFYKIREKTFSVHRTLVMYPSNPYLPIVNEIVRRLVESGIVNKIVDDIINPTGKRLGSEEFLDEYVSLTLFHMFSCFSYFAFGIILSVAVFFGEICLSLICKSSFKSKLSAIRHVELKRRSNKLL